MFAKSWYTPNINGIRYLENLKIHNISLIKPFSLAWSGWESFDFDMLILLICWFYWSWSWWWMEKWSKFTMLRAMRLNMSLFFSWYFLCANEANRLFTFSLVFTFSTTCSHHVTCGHILYHVVTFCITTYHVVSLRIMRLHTGSHSVSSDTVPYHGNPFRDMWVPSVTCESVPYHVIPSCITWYRFVSRNHVSFRVIPFPSHSPEMAERCSSEHRPALLGGKWEFIR